MKLHALIGTKTNVIAAATVTDRDAHDCPQFRPLVEMGAEVFDMERICADKAYSSRANLEVATVIGAEPYIPFKKGAMASTKWTRRSEVWEKLFHFYNFKRDEFLAAYHARSNAESTFSSIKRVFGDTLRSKTAPAQTNELLMKVIAHNIVSWSTRSSSLAWRCRVCQPAHKRRWLHTMSATRGTLCAKPPIAYR